MSTTTLATPSVTPTAAGGSTDILAVANSPILWVGAALVFLVIFVQTFLYVKAARRHGPDMGSSIKEINTAYRAGAVASIGPSLAVVLVAIALLALFGTPGVLVRVGLIGSAATETASAGIAANSMGAELGGPEYTQAVFAVAITAMTLSGAMWMLATLVLTPIMRRGSTKLQKANPVAMAVIPAAALLGAFSMITVQQLAKGSVFVVVTLVSAGVMGVLLGLAEKLKIHWLKEWALGFAILAALATALLMHAPTA